MASEKILNQKKAFVQELAGRLKAAKAIVLVEYKGIDVVNDTKLRADLRQENIDYSVVKNTLLALACKEAGMEGFLPYLTGSTSIALSDDETAAARILQKYVPKKSSGFNFKAGCINGKYMEAAELRAIALLPSRETLIAQVAGSFNSIIASLARGLSEVAKKQAA